VFLLVKNALAYYRKVKIVTEKVLLNWSLLDYAATLKNEVTLSFQIGMVG
jgi:hypothetical protein